MPETNLSFAKIVATPTNSSWSQAYNAGSLFMVFSLSTTAIEAPLNTTGKEFLNTLESEFFTLEDKNLQTIKQALSDSCQKLPAETSLSLAVVFIKQNILYTFSLNEGKILLRRDGKIGNILTSSPSPASAPQITTASGFLNNNDTIMLETASFVKAIPPDTLHKALELTLPSDIAETLSLPIHGMEEGGAASIIITFQGSSQTFVPQESADEEEKEITEPLPVMPAAPSSQPFQQPEVPTDPTTAVPPAPAPETPDQTVPATTTQPATDTEQTAVSVDTYQESRLQIFSKVGSLFAPLLSKVAGVIPFRNFAFTRRNKIILGIVALLLIALVAGIFLTRSKKKVSQNEDLFTKVYPGAQKDYDEGEGLLSLNKNLARDDFMAAQKKLLSIKDSFPAGSNEDKQIEDLLQKTNAQLQGSSGIKQTATTELPLSSNYLLSYASKHPDTPVTLTDSFLYAVTGKAIVQVDTGNDKEKSIFTNDDDWTSARSIGEYLGNLYVLDSKNGVLKFVSTSSDYEKSDYFKDSKPDTSKAVSLTVDGSIWLLLSDGTIEKFTKGNPDSFTPSGLDKPLSNPKQIVTNSDMSNLYILDSGNNRIVVFKKDGTYQAQYVAAQLGQATQLVINEKDKKADFLSAGKAYELNL